VVLDGELAGMPAPFRLERLDVGGEVTVSWGGRALFVYDPADKAMRNLAIVALTRAGVAGVEVARCFGLSAVYVSRLRSRAAEAGSAGLVPAMGRPAKLDEAGRRQAYALAEQGRSGREIAATLGVSDATISRLLARRPRLEPPALALEAEPDRGGGDLPTGDRGGDAASQPAAADRAAGAPAELDREAEDAAAFLARITAGTRECRYAGAMLLHGFLDRAGAGAVLAALPNGTARRYDAAALMLAASFGFALGSSSTEGAKHLLSSDAGVLIGTERFPHLRTLRPRLAALADAVDPLEVQVALARCMLDADERPPEVFFVDDHFVAYTGAAPVAKGWNTRHRHAEAGRDDTLIVDDAWRAICFATGAPSGLSKTMLDPLEQLRRVVGDRPVTIGFDRGGAYPATFAELNRRGLGWVTYRRAPLAPPTATPRRSWTIIDGQRRNITVADETITLERVGPVRQISVYDHDQVVLQILTSDTTTPAAGLAARLRARWCIENSFKYLEDHHGIHWLCDYHMDLAPDTHPVANPARAAARTKVADAERVVADLEHDLVTTATTPAGDPAATNAALARLTADLAAARADLAAAREALKPIPAKLPANQLDPTAARATPRTARRALQMVCRLLAYNTELDLSRALNTHLDDPDEYRAITRHLLHQPGTIAYRPDAITVTIRPPAAPRIATALTALTNQLNTNPPRLTGDRRPITYQIGPKP